MSNYYEGNGIYEYLAGCRERDHFYWTGQNMWLLVYGDRAHDPKVVTVASGRPFRYGRRPSEDERQAVQTALCMTEAAEIPVNFVRFDPEREVREVEYWEEGMNDAARISSEELKKRFQSCGLTMNRRKAQKAINDKSSSPYHEWQRAHMGSFVAAADVDLIRMKGGRPAEILELKRSFIPLPDWKPWRADYENFYLLSALAQRCGMRFCIVYNRRTKEPYRDDVSRLKLFSFDHTRETPCSFLGYETIEEFTACSTDRQKERQSWRR